MRIQLVLGVLLAAASLQAQSPLTTLFANNNSGGVGGCVLFDLTVNVPIALTSIDVNVNTPLGVAASLDVYTCPTTYLGNETNSVAWTLVGSASTAATGALNTPTNMVLTSPVILTPGTYGIQLKANGFGHAYTNGNGTNQTYTNAELTLSAGAAQNTQYTAPFTPRVFNGALYYNVSGGNYAAASSFGAGCVRSLASFYENFSAAASFDLSGTALTMVNTGTGYTVLPGLSPFIPPTPAATPLTLGDDTETSVTLATNFPYPGGSTPALTVCSNGFVSVGSGNGTGYTPSPATMLNNPLTGWYHWHDFNPSAAGSGQVKFEQVGPLAVITFDGVYDFGGASAASANTFQFQFDTASGNVHIAWGATSLAGNGILVGYSPGGPSADPTSSDLSTRIPATFTLGANDQLPLALGLSARPIIGTAVNWTTTNVPAASGLGILGLGFNAIVPGFDLTLLGAPGCFQHVGVSATTAFLPTGGTGTVPLAIPNSAALAGVRVLGQSLALDPSINALGLVTSNGLDLLVNPL